MWQLVRLTSNLMSLSLMVKLQLLLLVEVTKAKIITSPCCGVAPALIAESAPETPAAAMGMGKSAEQLGLFGMATGPVRPPLCAPPQEQITEAIAVLVDAKLLSRETLLSYLEGHKVNEEKRRKSHE